MFWAVKNNCPEGTVHKAIASVILPVFLPLFSFLPEILYRKLFYNENSRNFKLIGLETRFFGRRGISLTIFDLSRFSSLLGIVHKGYSR